MTNVFIAISEMMNIRTTFIYAIEKMFLFRNTCEILSIGHRPSTIWARDRPVDG
jgi:hypothetical protein